MQYYIIEKPSAMQLLWDVIELWDYEQNNENKQNVSFDQNTIMMKLIKSFAVLQK